MELNDVIISNIRYWELLEGYIAEDKIGSTIVIIPEQYKPIENLYRNNYQVYIKIVEGD